MKTRQAAINKSDFLDWKRNPVTQNYRELLKNEIEDLKDNFVLGKTIHREDLQRTAIETIELWTRIDQIRTILAINEVELDEQEI